MVQRPAKRRISGEGQWNFETQPGLQPARLSNESSTTGSANSGGTGHHLPIPSPVFFGANDMNRLDTPAALQKLALPIALAISALVHDGSQAAGNRSKDPIPRDFAGPSGKPALMAPAPHAPRSLQIWVLHGDGARYGQSRVSRNPVEDSAGIAVDLHQSFQNALCYPAGRPGLAASPANRKGR